MFRDLNYLLLDLLCASCIGTCVLVCVPGRYVCYITCFTGKILLQQNVNSVITQFENVKSRGIEPQKKKEISQRFHIFKCS